MSRINKPIKFLLLGVPLATTLFSCIQEGSVPEMETSKHEVNLTMRFTVSSDINTRDTRPLYSIDPWQRVTDMKVFVFRSENGEEKTFRLYYPEIKNSLGKLQKQEYIYIPEFDNKFATDENDGTWTRPENEEHEYTIKPMLPEGFYRFLAVGFDDPDNSPVKMLDWKESDTTWETAFLTNVSDTPVASEVFTGYPRDKEGKVETIHIKSDNGDVFTEIECRRSVAGVLLYLKNVPTTYKAEASWNGVGGATGIITSNLEKGQEYKIHEIALVTVGHNPEVDAVSRHWGNTFIPDQSRFKLTRLASIEVNKENTIEENSYIDEKGYIIGTFPAVGNFIMPSATYDATTTADYPGGIFDPDPKTYTFDKSLYLCFFTITGSGLHYPVKLWPVKLVRSYFQDDELENPDQCAGDLKLDEKDPLHYNLVANHLYCLGMYKDDESIDEPVDLKKEIKEHEEDAELTMVVVKGYWQYEINIEM